MTYVAKHPFDASHPDALAIYCSDGRFTEAVEELLRHLGHARLDTLTLPGGPALLELNTAGFSQLETARTSSSFLIAGHGIKRVVLGCRFHKYKELFNDDALGGGKTFNLFLLGFGGVAITPLLFRGYPNGGNGVLGG